MFKKISDNNYPACWILTTARTGSTFLSSLLNIGLKTSCLTEEDKNCFTEHFSPIVASYYSPLIFFNLQRIFYQKTKIHFNENNQNMKKFDDKKQLMLSLYCDNNIDIENILKNNHDLIPRRNKILQNQFRLMHWKNVYFKQYIDKIIPNMKYIILERENTYDQAISLYFSVYSLFFHFDKNNTKLKNKFLSMTIPFNERKILEIYNKIVIEKEELNNIIPFLDENKTLFVKYSNLVRDTKNEIKKIYSFLDITCLNYDQIIEQVITCEVYKSEKTEYSLKLKKLIT